MTDDTTSSGTDPSSAGCAGTFSRKGRRGSATPKQLALRQYARDMRSEPTEAERKLWLLLRDRRFSGFKFRRQVPIGSYIVDFVCLARRLVIEADGSQHGDSIRDVVRDAWLKAQGFRIRRFWNVDILTRPIEIQDTLAADLAGETDL